MPQKILNLFTILGSVGVITPYAFLSYTMFALGASSLESIEPSSNNELYSFSLYLPLTSFILMIVGTFFLLFFKLFSTKKISLISICLFSFVLLSYFLLVYFDPGCYLNRYFD